jgi:hypothetical protein
MDISGIGKKSAKKLKNPATSGDVSGNLDSKPAEAPSESEPISADLSGWLSANTEPSLKDVGIRQDTPSPEAAAEERGRVNEVNALPKEDLPTRGNKGTRRAARTAAFVPPKLQPSPEDATDLTALMRKQDATDTFNQMKAVGATGGDLDKVDKGPFLRVQHEDTQVTDDYSHFNKMHAVIDRMDNHLDTTGLFLPNRGGNVGALRDLITAARNHVNRAQQDHAEGKLHPAGIGMSSSRSTGTGRGRRPEELLNMSSEEMEPDEARALKHVMTNFPLEQKGAGAEDNMRAGVGAGGIFDNIPDGSAAHLFRAGQYVSQVASLLHNATKDIQDDEEAQKTVKRDGHEIPAVWNGHIKIAGDVKDITDSYGASVKDPNIMDRIAAGAQRAEATPEQVSAVFKPQRDRVKNLKEATAHHADIARQIATQAYHATFGAQLAARQTSYANRTAAWNAGSRDREAMTDASGNRRDFSNVFDADRETERRRNELNETLTTLRNEEKTGYARKYADIDDANVAERQKRTKQDIAAERSAAQAKYSSVDNYRPVVDQVMDSLKGHPLEEQFQSLLGVHKQAIEDLSAHVANAPETIPDPVNPFASGKLSESGIRQTVMSTPEYKAADASKDENAKTRVIAEQTRKIKNSDEYLAKDAAYKNAAHSANVGNIRNQTQHSARAASLASRVDETRNQFLKSTGYSQVVEQSQAGAPTINMRGVPSLEDYLAASKIPTDLVQQRREDGSYYLARRNGDIDDTRDMGGWQPATREEALKYVRNKYVSPGTTVQGALPAETNYIQFPNMSKRNPVRFPASTTERTGLRTPLAVRRDNISALEGATKADGTVDTVARRQGGRLREALQGYYSGDPSRMVTKQAFESRTASETLLSREQEWNAQGDNLLRDARQERVARSGDRLIADANHDLNLLAPMIDKAEKHMINLKSRSYARPERQAQHEEEIAAHGEVLKKHYQHRDMLTAQARTAQTEVVPMMTGGGLGFDRITGAQTADYNTANDGVNTVFGNPNLKFKPKDSTGGEKQWWEDEEDPSDEDIAEKLSLSNTGMVNTGTRKLLKSGNKEAKQSTGIPAGYQIEDGDISGSVGEPEIDESEEPDETPEAENVQAVAKARVAGVYNPRKRK